MTRVAGRYVTCRGGPLDGLQVPRRETFTYLGEEGRHRALNGSEGGWLYRMVYSNRDPHYEFIGFKHRRCFSCEVFVAREAWHCCPLCHEAVPPVPS